FWPSNSTRWEPILLYKWKCLPSLKRCISYSENRVAPVSGCAVNVWVVLVIVVPVYNGFNTSYGDQHPIRSVVQLVVQFIDGLFQYISLQQDPEVAWVFGHEAGSFDLFKISL